MSIMCFTTEPTNLSDHITKILHSSLTSRGVATTQHAGIHGENQLQLAISAVKPHRTESERRASAASYDISTQYTKMQTR